MRRSWIGTEQRNIVTQHCLQVGALKNCFVGERYIWNCPQHFISYAVAAHV